MAKELLNPIGGPNSQYHLLIAKIKLAKNQLEEAEKHITESLSFDYQVKKTNFIIFNIFIYIFFV